MRCYHLDRNEAVGRSPEFDEMNVGGVRHSEPAGGNSAM